MNKVFILAFAVLFLFLIKVDFALAHSGRTDSSGCHNCYTSECYGEYHCHNGGYATSYTPVYAQIPQAPSLTASFVYKPNSDGKTFNVEMDWSDTTNTGYSIALNRYAGADPGPLTDTNSSKWVFNNIPTGTYYANLKVGINNTWSTVTYWKVEVPKWYAPAPIPTAIPVAQVNPTSPSGDILPLLILGIIGILVFWVCVYLLYRFVQWFIKYANEHEGVYTLVFWIVVIGIIFFANLFTSKSNTLAEPKPTYRCNCSKTCPNMTCTEAYYQLNSCGCSARDGDNDGVPCEAQCN